MRSARGFLKNEPKPGVVVHVCSAITREAEAGNSPCFKARLSCTVCGRPAELHSKTLPQKRLPPKTPPKLTIQIMVTQPSVILTHAFSCLEHLN